MFDYLNYKIVKGVCKKKDAKEKDKYYYMLVCEYEGIVIQRMFLDGEAINKLNIIEKLKNKSK